MQYFTNDRTLDQIFSNNKDICMKLCCDVLLETCHCDDFKGNGYTFKEANPFQTVLAPFEKGSTLKGKNCSQWEQILSFLGRPLFSRNLM